MANLHEAQLTVLLKVIGQIDIDKATYFQPVNLTEEETELIHQIPNEYVQLTSSGIQLSPTAIDIAKEYRSVRWWAEHKNDTIYELGIDIETYSSVDLTTSGVYKYAEAEDFTILLFAYSVNGSPVMCADLASGEQLPDKIKDALTDKSVLKTAFNANFERVCLSRYLGTWLEPDDWDCTMVRAARLGLPLSLAQCGAVLGLEQQKMKEGKALINYFSKPCKATKVNGGRTRNLPEHAPDKWATFKRYCIRDVEVEQAIRRKVERLSVTDTERKAWLLDQRINDRGVLIDLQMAKKASDIDDEYRCKLEEEARQITGLDNPNSPVQLKAWLKAETGIDFPSIDKESVADALPRINSLKAKRILQIRQELGKTSTAKYKAMLTCACKDGRAKGLFQFYGANRSGRFCLTGDHEVLTDDGWVRLEEWKGGKIACWNMSSEIISFQKSTPNEFDYQGEMYHACNKRCDILCTPNHKIPYWTEEGWKTDEMQNLVKRHSIPFWGLRQNTIARNGETELRILIMVQADGHYTEEGTLTLHFTKQRKIERCTKLLRKGEIVFTRKVNSDKSTTFYVNWKQLPLYLRAFNKKNFGSWILKENADTFFDELQYWDGYRSSQNSMQYVTTNKINADLIQALGLINGKSVTMLIKEPKQNRVSTKDRANTAYVLNVWDNPGHHSTIRIEDISKEQFSGKVYCPTTPTGFFLVRRNGKCWVTGNSGRNLQLQNLPQNHIPDIDYARNLVKNGSLDDIVLEYGNVPKLLSELIRTALIAKDGCTFHVCDFSAIEARVLAWLAGEDWVLNVFRNNGDIYCATASQMFGVPVEKHGRNAELRQKGKVATLACIAEGELVLTDKGLVPIQDVTLQHRLWNGLEWVHHEGVIFKGYKRVIKYEGLTATPDHIVYVYEQGTGKPREIQFGIAAACGSHLVQTGNGGANIRLGENNFPREKMESRMESSLCSDRMHGLRRKAMAVLKQSKKRYIERLSVLQSNKKSYSPEVVSEKSNSAETKMPEPARSKLSFIWGTRDKILFQQCLRSCRVYDKYFRFTFARFRNRPYRQQWELREGEYPICHTERELCEQKNHGIISFRSKILGLFRGHSKAQAQSRVYKRTNNGASQTSSKGQAQGMEDHSAEVRVYDILNAEGHHCFTVSNKLVHNCGYGGGVNALKAMGADKMGLADSELADIISKYRLANPHIVRLWKHIGAATRAALKGEALPIERGITFEMKWGGMCITLPSKRQLFYPRMHINANNRFEFEGMDQIKKVWGLQETYEGKLTENIIQGVARDILVETMLRLEKAGLNIVFHVHDETIIEATPNQKLEDIEDIFSMDIPWAKGLPLKGAGYTTPYYLKD